MLRMIIGVGFMKVSKKNKNHCLFCGEFIPKNSVIRGAYHLDACVNPSCPYHGAETGSEYESLEGFTIFGPESDEDYDF